GKMLALPSLTREHCRVFLRHHCKTCGKDPERFFSRITRPKNMEEALEDVVDGKVQATVVDNVSLACFKDRKPGRFGRLKTLRQSEVFPASVIAYQHGSLDEATLRRFREGLLTADKTPAGRQ